MAEQTPYVTPNTVPSHLSTRSWYAPHLAWCQECGYFVRHDPAGTAPVRANLTGADLAGANLTGADLADANLARANLADADLTGADLTGAFLADANLADANLTGAYLRGAFLADANLADANLTGAYLRGANLTDANLARANLTGADLARAGLADANLTGASMPDGRKWENYWADHMAGICDIDEVRERAIAAWGRHQWSDCPMHAALGIGDLRDISDERLRLLVACWVALYDAGLLPDPREDGAA